ncbi:kalirin-like isoform X3 [Vespula maculifrons]|uniref:Kalirin-like isoform X3 n=1 Tax=Vespula maculifrons TaxID=7453 RepID=A0ABD2BUG9_VESMC
MLVKTNLDARVPTTEPVVRETISVAPTFSTASPGTMNKEKSIPQQKITRPIQRTQYGGLDCELPRTPSPTKSRLNFLDGFRNTLRARSPVRTNSIPQRGSSPS